MSKTLLPAALLLLLACMQPGFAQTQPTVEAIDPSLLTSEPLDEEPPVPEEKMPVPPKAIVMEKPLPPPPEPPPPEYDTAILRGLKKVTAETSTVEAPIDNPVTFGTLTILVKKCVKAAPDERPENAALIKITDNKPGEPANVVFSGWMISSSPAISAMENPVYDITMLDCAVKKKKAEAPKPAKPSGAVVGANGLGDVAKPVTRK
jgi:hypothetical protein